MVEVKGLPYWQQVEADWDKNFRMLDVVEDIESVREQAEFEVSQASEPGEGLPMSDLFSFIALRAATRYEGEDGAALPLPMISPISLRESSLAPDEGNDRAIRTFPFVFRLESVADMHRRIASLEPTSSSYDTAGKIMKVARRFSFMEPTLRSFGFADFISNYFPLADMQLALGDAKLLSHDLRVPMVPYERTKFAWSNYNGEVQLFLHTDPLLIEKQRMLESFQVASQEVLQFLSVPD